MDGDNQSFWSSDTIWFYVSLVLCLVFIFQAGIWYGRQTSTTTSTPTTAQAQQKDPNPTVGNNPQPSGEAASLPELPSWLKSVPTHPQEKAMGNPDAPVTVTEYIDFECPFCQRYNRQVFPRILENYIQPGKVYYEVKHYPLPMHDRAVPAGNAAECAVQQGKFWAFKHVVMNSDQSLSDSTLKQIGKHIGIRDTNDYKECIDSMRHESVVNREKSSGSDRGVSATPTVLIEGRKIEGAQSYSRYKQAIEEALSS